MLGEDVPHVPGCPGGRKRLPAVDVKTCHVLWHSGRSNGRAPFNGGAFNIEGATASPGAERRPVRLAEGG